MARKSANAAEREALLWQAYGATKSEESKHGLAEHYFPFVKRIAVKVAEKLSWQVSPEELASFGVDGLYKAIEGFAPERKVKFESYASRRIRGSMIDGLRREDKIPRSVRMASDKFDRARQALQNKHHVRIDDEEVAVSLGVDGRSFHRNPKRFIPVKFSSLDSHVNHDVSDPDELAQDSNINLRDASVPMPSANLCRKEFFSKLLGKDFSKIERRIMYLYYYEDMTMDKVAESISLSESRVSQMHKRIILRLREKIRRNPTYFGDDVYRFLSEARNRESLF